MREQNSCRKDEENGEGAIWDVMTSSEEWNGTKADKLLHAGTNGHQRLWQNGEKNPDS